MSHGVSDALLYETDGARSQGLIPGAQSASRSCPNPTVPLKWIEYGVYEDRIRMYQEPYSIYLKDYTPLNTINT